MFEQSLLVDHGGSQKGGAFIASLAAQILVGGVLILIPLIFTDSLRIVPIVAQLPMLVASAPPPPPIVESMAPPSSAPPTFSVRRDFRPVPSTRAAVTPASQALVMDAGPVGIDVSTPGAGVTFGLAGETMSMLRVAPPVREPVKETISVSKPADAVASEPVRVSGSLQSSKIIQKVIPVYPSPARAARISGAVHLVGIIGIDGKIRELKVLDGPMLLRQAALDAVKQWVYSPTILSGMAVEVEAPITVEFTMR